MFQSIIDFFKSLYYSINKPSLPSLKSATRIYRDATKDLKICSVFVTSKGVVFTPYHNVSRRDSWVKVLEGNSARTLFSFTQGSNQRETAGTPDKVGDWWYIPTEAHNMNIPMLNDKNLQTKYSFEQPDVYATRCVEGFIPFNYKGRPIQFWDVVNKKKIKEWSTGEFEGIVSGIAKYKDGWVLSVMDGSNPGIAYIDKGGKSKWILRGEYPEVAVLNGKLLGFTKKGEVHLVDNGKVTKKIGNTGNKAQRARVKGGLCYWSTANWDQIWVTDGSSIKMLAEFKDGDKGDGANSGSLFNTSMDFDGNDIIFGRSIDNKGFEIYRVSLK